MPTRVSTDAAMTSGSATPYAATPMTPRMTSASRSVARSATTTGATRVGSAPAASLSSTALTSSPSLPGVTDIAKPPTKTRALAGSGARTPTRRRYSSQRAKRMT